MCPGAHNVGPDGAWQALRALPGKLFQWEGIPRLGLALFAKAQGLEGVPFWIREPEGRPLRHVEIWGPQVVSP